MLPLWGRSNGTAVGGLLYFFSWQTAQLFVSPFHWLIILSIPLRTTVHLHWPLVLTRLSNR
jgi:hypothetical protein